jgi:hypothetical protein
MTRLDRNEGEPPGLSLRSAVSVPPGGDNPRRSPGHRFEPSCESLFFHPACGAGHRGSPMRTKAAQ